MWLARLDSSVCPNESSVAWGEEWNQRCVWLFFSQPCGWGGRGGGRKPSLEQGYWAGNRQKMPSTRDLSNVTQPENGTPSPKDSYILSILLHFRIMKLFSFCLRDTRGEAQSFRLQWGFGELMAVSRTVFPSSGEDCVGLAWVLDDRSTW